MKLHKIKIIIALIALASSLQGCVPVLIGSAIYHHGKTKESYSKYVAESQKNNTEREKNGLKPLQILSYDEWGKGVSQPIAASSSESISTKGTKEAYSQYVIESQKNNTEREKNGLKPLSVLSYEDWSKGVGQPAASSSTITNQLTAPTSTETNKPAVTPLTEVNSPASNK